MNWRAVVASTAACAQYGGYCAAPRNIDKTIAMDDIYFEDVTPGAELRAGPYVIPEHEMMAFAAAWDPMPMHVDRAYGEKHGGLTTPGLYLLAINMRLIHTLPMQRTVIASFGYDEVRFHRPARPGDALTLTMKWTEKRRSKSNPERGIVGSYHALTNTAGEVVLSHLDTILMLLRDPSA
jgi:acyl dehydratase